LFRFLFYFFNDITVKTLVSVSSHASNKNGKSKYCFPTRIVFV